MELRRLRYFVCIVDAGSLTKASERLHIAQPALSVQMGKLETELGVELLVRAPRGVTPTEEGKTLYRHAQILLKMVSDSRDVVRRDRHAAAGRVRLGLPAFVSGLVAGPLIKLVRERCPAISLEIHEHLGMKQMLQLQTEEVDISLVTDTGETDASIHLEPVMTEPMVFMRARRAGAQPLPARMPLVDVVEHPLVMPIQAGYRVKLEKALAPFGRVPTIVAEAKAAPIIADLVASGVGNTLMPHSNIRGHSRLDELEFCAVEPAIHRTLSIGYTSVYPMTRAARVVCDTLRELLREQVESGEWIGGRMIEPAPAEALPVA